MVLDEEFIIQLESKVDALVDRYTRLKEQHAQLSSEIDSKNSRIQELEGENDSLRNELSSMKDMSADQRNKLDTAAERVQALITKLEAVEQ